MVSTQCPKCGRVLNDAEVQNEGQAIDKHQKAQPECHKAPAAATAPAASGSLAEAIRKARGV